MRHFFVILTVASIMVFGNLAQKAYEKHKINRVLNNVYKLYSPEGSCSAIGIIAPSGKSYVLTAGHCHGLIVSGKIQAVDERGREYFLPVVAEDSKADLLLLEAPVADGIYIADKVERHEHVYSMTHGHGYPTYRTDGEIIKSLLVTFPEEKIDSISGLLACSGSKNMIGKDGNDLICYVSTFDLISTAWIVPGSSGGPLLNDAGQLVGIASATGGDMFSAFVSLNDIHDFLRTK